MTETSTLKTNVAVIIDHENPTPIDLLTVYDADDAILAGGETRLKLQLTYEILAHWEPL